MSTLVLKNHKLAGTWNGGEYTVTVTRQKGAYRYDQQQYSYHASIRRNDGVVVNVALATLRAAKIGWTGAKEFPNNKFSEWLNTARLRGDTGATPAGAVVAKAADVVSIDTDYTKTAKVTINIQKTFEGDADDVRDELYDLISQLEDAIREIED